MGASAGGYAEWNPDGAIGLKGSGLSSRGKLVSDSLSRAWRYRQCVTEYVELAKPTTSNEIRSHHYAIVERYLRLAEVEEKMARCDNGLHNLPPRVQTRLASYVG
jgi:hypothetical protein